MKRTASSWVLMAMCVLPSVSLGKPDAVSEVPLIRLIANPQAYEGQRVRVVGFVNVSLEDEAVFLSREAWENHAYANALRLGISVKAQERLDGNFKRFLSKPGYAEIEGEFRAVPAGRTPYSGMLIEISELEPWQFADVRREKTGCW